MRFEKWQGLGNDFVIVERDVSPQRARELCDRRRGIGADGVLVVTSLGDVVRMVVHNADGSRPEMCGNGLRCVAGFIHGRQGLDELVIETDAGPRRCVVTGSKGAYQVTAGMGVATIVAELEHAGRSFVRVDVGNPHAVTFERFDDSELDLVGSALDLATDGGINVEMCRMRDGLVETIVWERGVGRTQACGTGACAVAAAAVHLGHKARQTAIDVALPGGLLTIELDADDGLQMRGPARHVFSGAVS